MSKMTKKEKDRLDKLEKICKKINEGDHGGVNNDAVSFLGTQEVKSIERFPSGCADLDDALGGGYPRGRFVEIFGPESGGKTTHCLHAIAEFQKAFPGE
jgi:recombination protein RecA